MNKKRIIFILTFMVIVMMFTQIASAEAAVPFIEHWENNIAYDGLNNVISSCVAYDYKSEQVDKFVLLDDAGREVVRKSSPEDITDENSKRGIIQITAVVPENIDTPIEVVLWDKNGETYSALVFKEKNYTAELSVPEGRYEVFSANLKNDFKNSYPITCSAYDFIVTPDSNVVLTLNVSDSSGSNKENSEPTPEIIEGDVEETIEPSATYATNPPTATASETVEEDNSIQGKNHSLLKSTIFTFIVLMILGACYYIFSRKKQN